MAPRGVPELQFDEVNSRLNKLHPKLFPQRHQDNPHPKAQHAWIPTSCVPPDGVSRNLCHDFLTLVMWLDSTQLPLSDIWKDEPGGLLWPLIRNQSWSGTNRYVNAKHLRQEVVRKALVLSGWGFADLTDGQETDVRDDDARAPNNNGSQVDQLGEEQDARGDGVGQLGGQGREDGNAVWSLADMDLGALLTFSCFLAYGAGSVLLAACLLKWTWPLAFEALMGAVRRSLSRFQA